MQQWELFKTVDKMEIYEVEKVHVFVLFTDYFLNFSFMQQCPCFSIVSRPRNIFPSLEVNSWVSAIVII